MYIVCVSVLYTQIEREIECYVVYYILKVLNTILY